MTLLFSQQYKDGTPNFFIEKEWRGFLQEGIFKIEQYFEYAELHKKQFRWYWDGFTLEIQYQLDNNFPDGILPKKHTLRKGEKWHEGDKFTPTTDDGFQFAPVCRVKSVRRIWIEYENKDSDYPAIYIDGMKHIIEERNGVKLFEDLAKNDGFNSLEQFFDWFNEDFEGQIIWFCDGKY